MPAPEGIRLSVSGQVATGHMIDICKRCLMVNSYMDVSLAISAPVASVARPVDSEITTVSVPQTAVDARLG